MKEGEISTILWQRAKAMAITSFLVLYWKDLYRIGARKIAVFGLPPIGCVPSQRTFRGGVLRQCADNYNQMSQLFNTKLIAEINSLNSKYPKAKIVYGDIYNLPLDLIYNPQKYGIHLSFILYKNQIDKWVHYFYANKLNYNIYFFHIFEY